MAIPAAFLIDKVGRRLLLLTTFPLMSLFQLATGLSFGPVQRVAGRQIVSYSRHIAIVIFAYLFCVTYSIGEGPVPLVSINILPAYYVKNFADSLGLRIRMSSLRSERYW